MLYLLDQVEISKTNLIQSEVLNLLESLVLLSSTPQTLAVSKNIFVVAFHFSGKPLGIVDEKDV